MVSYLRIYIICFSVANGLQILKSLTAIKKIKDHFMPYENIITLYGAKIPKVYVKKVVKES